MTAAASSRATALRSFVTAKSLGLCHRPASKFACRISHTTSRTYSVHSDAHAGQDPMPRLNIPSEAELSPKQRELLSDIQKTRGKGPLGGPFAVFLHAPEYGDLAQKLGAFCRYKTSVPPHLSEFTILVLARFWRSQYEFWVHAPIAEKAGVKAATIEALRTGREPRADQRAACDLRFHRRTAQDEAGLRQDLRARPRAVWRCRHGRVCRHPRLLHAGRDDAERLPRATAGRRGLPVRRAEPADSHANNCTHRTSGIGLPARPQADGQLPNCALQGFHWIPADVSELVRIRVAGGKS